MLITVHHSRACFFYLWHSLNPELLARAAYQFNIETAVPVHVAMRVTVAGSQRALVVAAMVAASACEHHTPVCWKVLGYKLPTASTGHVLGFMRFTSDSDTYQSEIKSDTFVPSPCARDLAYM